MACVGRKKENVDIIGKSAFKSCYIAMKTEVVGEESCHETRVPQLPNLAKLHQYLLVNVAIEIACFAEEVQGLHISIAVLTQLMIHSRN